MQTSGSTFNRQLQAGHCHSLLGFQWRSHGQFRNFFAILATSAADAWKSQQVRFVKIISIAMSAAALWPMPPVAVNSEPAREDKELLDVFESESFEAALTTGVMTGNGGGFPDEHVDGKLT
mmetsp:Transcript_22853/g.58298  ORF Transcript_22853/g.58298 Transcript_22853/m.58298 type:complete len:121 (+) Transcript_22853:113-475(+)